MYDCEDCVRRLDQLVDKELSTPEVEEIHIHLGVCGDCTRRYRFQEGFKRLVKVSYGEVIAPAALRDKLRQHFTA